MGNAPKKRVSWLRLVPFLLVLFAFAGLHFYRDSQRPEGGEVASVVATVATVVIGLLILGGVFWYANRPERTDNWPEQEDER